MKPSLRLLLPLLLLVASPALAAEPEGPSTIITSQNLDMQSTDDESTFVFTGLVTVLGNNMQLRCDRLEAVTTRAQKDILRDKEKTSLGQVGKFKSLVATGRVRIEQGDRVATCGRAVVLPGEERITLTEDPMVRDGESTAVGETITLLRGQRRAIIDKARITLPGLKDLGFHKDTPAPTPEPAVPAKPANGAPAKTTP